MDNKSAIIENAIKLFADKGYDAISVQQIVEASGVTKPTLYYYFGNKEGVLKECVQVKFNHMKECINYNCYTRDLPFTLFKLIKEYFVFAQNEYDFYRMKLSMMYSFTENQYFSIVEPIWGEEVEILEELFLKASEHHGNMKGRHKAYAASFLGIINVYIRLSYMDSIELSDDLAFKVAHQFMHGIFS